MAHAKQLYTKNSSSSKVDGRGKIVLKMTSGKNLTLNEVLYVLYIWKNLVYGSLLSKNMIKLVFVLHKFVLSKNDMFLRKGLSERGAL